ncbi:MAG: glycosyltransferase family 4 protein [Planctomycetaceae bacterium]|nr:glycosyltransferase family 4 protein [Planctomycetales bacterium]MCB9920676.1 glycosyltransferase family 4 protein [Planctomycetaceae bacterium]
MKILILADNFTPEIVATSFRTHEHAKVWLEEGHDVTVVTCVPNWPLGKVFDGYKNKLYQEEWIDGIRVIRLWSYITANKGFFKRTLDYVSYMVMAVLFAWRYPKFDVILATSPQFFTALAGYLVSRLRRRPWVFELRDLWPESIRAVGASNSRVLDLLENLELFLYRKADRIVALTNSFRRNLVARGIESRKIDVVPNGVDLQQFNQDRISFDAREQLGIAKDAFLVGYIGTTGMAHGLETVLDAAELSRERQDVVYLIMGQGASRAQLEQSARERQLSNIVFSDSVPHRDIPSVYAALDMSLVHLRPDPLFKTVIPSKIFEAMAMECPILMAVEGEAAEIVERTGSGICISSGCPESLAEAVLKAASDPGGLAAFGQRGRRAVTTSYDRRVKAREVLSTLLSTRGQVSHRRAAA